MIDYLIIGQGIAGTMLAYFFEERGVPFKIVDAVDYGLTKNSSSTLLTNHFEHPFHGASNISTGIINPVTGRRFVKSWMIETLFPFAEKTYQQIEQKLQISFYKKTRLYRTIPDQKAMNDFLLRLDDRSYEPFFSKNNSFVPDEKHFNMTKKGVTIKQVAKVDVPHLLRQYRHHLIKNGVFIRTNLDYNKIHIKDDYCEVVFEKRKKEKFKRLIFCEGYRVKDNPFFNFLPFTGSNGQTLIIQAPQLQLSYLLKSGIFVIPIGNQHYQIGTTWDWDINKPTTTSEGFEKLISKITTLLKIPFTVLDHQAAVRPTIKDRRPVLGRHPQHTNIYLLNGLGTKGVSLSPYFTIQLVDFLLKETPLLKEVSINRFLTT